MKNDEKNVEENSQNGKKLKRRTHQQPIQKKKKMRHFPSAFLALTIQNRIKFPDWAFRPLWGAFYAGLRRVHSGIIGPRKSLPRLALSVRCGGFFSLSSGGLVTANDAHDGWMDG